MLDILAREILKTKPGPAPSAPTAAGPPNALVLLMSALVGPRPGPLPEVPTRADSPYLAAFDRAARVTGLSDRLGHARAVNVLRAISLHENPRQDPAIRARNRNGTYDHGLMQVNDVNLRDFQGDITDPAANIELGARVFAQFLGRRTPIEEALSRYNAGYRNRAPDGTRRNQAYVDSVLRNLRRLEQGR